MVPGAEKELNCGLITANDCAPMLLISVQPVRLPPLSSNPPLIRVGVAVHWYVVWVTASVASIVVEETTRSIVTVGLVKRDTSSTISVMLLPITVITEG